MANVTGRTMLEIDWDTISDVEGIIKILKLLHITIEPGSQAASDLKGHLKLVALPATAADIAKLV